jgi:hypothetical protein
MDTLVKADVFFFIAAIATVVISVLLAVVLVYLIKILNDVKHISRIAKREVDLIREDIENLRVDIKRRGLGLLPFFNFFSKIYARVSKQKVAPKDKKK